MLDLAVLPLCFALALPTPSQPGDTPKDPDLGALTAELARIASRDGGVVGVHVLHLESGRTASLRATERFPMASTYKVAIAIAVLDRVDEGTLRLGQRVEVRKDDLLGGGPESVKKMWKPGLALSVEDLLGYMVTESDNTATDVLFRVLDGPKTVARALAARKITGIDVSRTEHQLWTDKGGDAKDTRDTAEPAAMTALISRLHRGELLSAAGTERLLDLMRRCKTGDARIRALLPKGTAVGDKTGSARQITNDVGIVTLPGGAGHLALAIYIKGSPADDKSRDRTVAELARAAFDAFTTTKATAGS